MKNIVSLILFLTLMFVVGCSKDDDSSNPTGPTTAEGAPTFKTHTIAVPARMQQSADIHAQTVVLYMGLANAFGANLSENLTPPSLNKPTALHGDGPWEHNWKDGKLNIRVLIKKVAGNFTWEVFYTGNDGTYDYVNFIAFRADQALDERSGSFYAYLPNTSIVLGRYTWSLDDNDVLHFEVLASGYTEGNRFVGVVNADHSGTLEIYKSAGNANVLLEKYQWDNEGAGEWWQYKEGTLVDSGTWN